MSPRQVERREKARGARAFPSVGGPGSAQGSRASWLLDRSRRGWRRGWSEGSRALRPHPFPVWGCFPPVRKTAAWTWACRREGGRRAPARRGSPRSSIVGVGASHLFLSSATLIRPQESPLSLLRQEAGSLACVRAQTCLSSVCPGLLAGEASTASRVLGARRFGVCGVSWFPSGACDHGPRQTLGLTSTFRGCRMGI